MQLNNVQDIGYTHKWIQVSIYMYKGAKNVYGYSIHAKVASYNNTENVTGNFQGY